MRVILAADQIDEIVGAEVPFLAQEDVDDEIALAGALAAGRPQPAEIRKSDVHHGTGQLGSADRARSPCSPRSLRR